MNKKGFTLIELLAVIVVLSIIALIVTPIITGIIDDTKKNALLRSIEAYVNTVETYSLKSVLNKQDAIPATGVYTVEYLKDKIQFKGNGPTEGWIKLEANKVTDYSLKIDNNIINYDTNNLSPIISMNDILVEKPIIGNNVYLLGQVVYFNPINNTKCDSTIYSKYGTTDFNSLSIGTCYRWRVLEINDNSNKSSITLQLDHNLVNISQWAPSTSSTGPITALDKLVSATKDWSRVNDLNYVYDSTTSAYNYKSMICKDGSCTLNSNPVLGVVKARMITAEEVTDITNTKATSNALSKTWKITSSDYYYFSDVNHKLGSSIQEIGQGDNTTFNWLIENTGDYEQSNAHLNLYGDEIYGYWTLSPFSHDNTRVFYVNFGGSLSDAGVINNARCGIRPVINVEKSKITY